MLKKRSISFFTFCLLLTANTQAQTLEQKAIEYAKGLSLSLLDSTLSQARFSEWLAKIVGDTAVVRWELNDCGEQTGDPVRDNNRDFPLCVGVYITFPDHRALGIMILVGTHNKGIVSDPGVFNIYLESKGKFQTIRYLSDLQNTLKQSLE